MSLGKPKQATTTTATKTTTTTRAAVPTTFTKGVISQYSRGIPVTPKSLFIAGNRGSAFIDPTELHGVENPRLGSHGCSPPVDREVGLSSPSSSSSQGHGDWPSLPGNSNSPLKQVRAKPCWAWRSPTKPRSINLGSLGEWPCLEQGKERVRSQGLDFLAGNGGFSASSSGPDEREDILASTGPTEENQLKSLHLGDFPRRGGGGGDSGGLVGGGVGSGGVERCKGWVRLAPIPKRWRVENPSAQDSNSNSNSNSLGPVGGNIFKGRDGGGDGCRGGHGGEGVPPVYLMLNRDFIVISPLKENLLLTLALTRRNPVTQCEPDMEAEAEAEAEVVCRSKRPRMHVFVGRFEAFSSFMRFGLGRDAKRVVNEANAGGTSTISESLSVEYFVRKFQAKDVVTEMEVEYCAMNWKKVDYICSLYEQRVGVSVTRAMSYPNPEDFSAQMAYRLLYKKLFGLVVARHGVTERHSFSQCILHVWCETTTTAKLLEDQYRQVSEELDITDDVIMVLTVAEGWHARPIFYEHCLDRSL